MFPKRFLSIWKRKLVYIFSDLKHDYGQFLPKGFDYRKHLAFVRAACL